MLVINVVFYRVEGVFIFWIKLALQRKFYRCTSSTTTLLVLFVS